MLVGKKVPAPKAFAPREAKVAVSLVSDVFSVSSLLGVELIDVVVVAGELDIALLSSALRKLVVNDSTFPYWIPDGVCATARK